jgi:hypothetical protein
MTVSRSVDALAPEVMDTEIHGMDLMMARRRFARDWAQIPRQRFHRASLTCDSPLPRRMTIEIHFEHVAGRRWTHLLYMVQGVEAGLVEIG